MVAVGRRRRRRGGGGGGGGVFDEAVELLRRGLGAGLDVLGDLGGCEAGLGGEVGFGELVWGGG